MPKVSVLITTYNRSTLLPRALDSVLKQDYEDFELFVADDCSTDNTPEVVAEYTDSRIHYVRHPENIASKHGDKAIFRRFTSEQARGDYFVWLCDDDYWIPTDLLSTQVGAMEKYESLAFSMGGSAFIYDRLDELPTPNEPYITYERAGDIPHSMFPRNMYPDGFIDRFKFLDLYASDPKNRNMVTSATLHRRAVFERAGVFKEDNGVRWQSGYEMIAGAATEGDVYYLDRPCVGTAVDMDSASYRGSQYDHMMDCLHSASAGFRHALTSQDQEYVEQMQLLRSKMLHSILFIYILNKLTFRLGHFKDHPLREIERIFVPEITDEEFRACCEEYGIPLSADNQTVLSVSGMAGPELEVYATKLKTFSGGQGHWWRNMILFPN